MDIVLMYDCLLRKSSKDNDLMDDGLIDNGLMKSCGALVGTQSDNSDASLSKTPFCSSIGRKTCSPKSNRFLSNSNHSLLNALIMVAVGKNVDVWTKCIFKIKNWHPPLQYFRLTNCFMRGMAMSLSHLFLDASDSPLPDGGWVFFNLWT
jgi:hypothetical protein